MMYWEQYSGGFQQAVRWGRWKGHYQAAKEAFEAGKAALAERLGYMSADGLRLLAETMLDNAGLKDLLAKNW